MVRRGVEEKDKRARIGAASRLSYDPYQPTGEAELLSWWRTTEDSHLWNLQRPRITSEGP